MNTAFNVKVTAEDEKCQHRINHEHRCEVTKSTSWKIREPRRKGNPGESATESSPSSSVDGLRGHMGLTGDSAPPSG